MQTAELEEDPDASPPYDWNEVVLGALDGNAATLRGALARGDRAVAAVYAGARYGAVVVAYRRFDGELDDQTFILERAADGRWIPPDGASGPTLADWALNRPEFTHPEWHGKRLVQLGSQVAAFTDRARQTSWVIAFVLMASRGIHTIGVEYGDQIETLPVPDNGLVVAAMPVGRPDDRVVFHGYDAAGAPVDQLDDAPFTEADRRDGWPSTEFWR